MPLVLPPPPSVTPTAGVVGPPLLLLFLLLIPFILPYRGLSLLMARGRDTGINALLLEEGGEEEEGEGLIN